MGIAYINDGGLRKGQDFRNFAVLDYTDGSVSDIPTQPLREDVVIQENVQEEIKVQEEIEVEEKKEEIA